MLKNFREAVFSIAGMSIGIAVIGAASSFVTLFVSTSEQISVKWLLFAVVSLLYIIIILIKITHDALRVTTPTPRSEKPIKYDLDAKVFLIRKNDSFAPNTIVGCYSQRDEVDRLAYIGVVLLIQEKFIQIKIQADLKVLASIPKNPDELKHIEIRPVVPFESLQKLTQGEHENE